MWFSTVTTLLYSNKDWYQVRGKGPASRAGFAKLLNPKIEGYRIVSSKLFVDIPYFLEAYIPLLTGEDPKYNVILRALLKDDWTQSQKTYEKLGTPFFTMES